MSIITNVLLDWKIFVFGFGILASVSIINVKIPILPVSCITFIVSSIFVWFTSMCITLVCLHKLLQKNEPLEITLKSRDKVEKDQRKRIKPNPERVEILTKDIDKYFISKWYANISNDGDFTDESRRFIEEVISRLAEIQLFVDNKVLMHGVLNIYLKHYKEFRRSLKRKEKYAGSIEELYRYSHVCSTNSKPKEYFIHQLTTNLLQHFINSELWNSSPCQVLVSILARRLVSFILKLLSDPEILNYVLLNFFASNVIKEQHDLISYSRISIIQNQDVTDSPDHRKYDDKESLEKINKIEDHQKEDNVEERKVQMRIEPEILGVNHSHKKKRNKTSGKKIDIAEELKEIPATVQHTTSDPVTIFEPKSHRITNTWNDPKDLILGVSLGTDPLDSFPVENVKATGKSTFWDSGIIDHYEDSTHAANLLLNEVKQTTQTTMEGLKSSIKPISDATVNTLHNIKDLQESTMNNALHKIGDFQDEAAGVVEGILDFGRARFREGLRLTGLQDNMELAKAPPTSGVSLPPKQTQPMKKKEAKLARISSKEKLSLDDDNVWMNPLQMDSPNFDGQILLEKTNVTEEIDKRDLQIPSISTEQPDSSITESPDLEYEDTADLASSIAKLRSLLQQRSSESSLSTPALSPILAQAKYYGAKRSDVINKIAFFNNRPPDDFASRPTEAECVSDLDEVDGVMPSFYKFCAKTATGVLDKTIHTIKTALPGNPQGSEQADNAWIFIQQDNDETDILVRMKKLLTERKEYCILDNEIDTAYEAIDSLDTFQMTFTSNVAFEDELDAFEVKLPITKALLDIFCEILADTDSPFIQEPLVRAVLLSMGTTLEKYLIDKMDKVMENVCVDLIMIPEKTNTNKLSMEIDTYVDAILTSLPDVLKLTFGKSTLIKPLKVFITSLQSQKINQDVLLQFFELIVMKLIEESNQISPPASA